MAIQHKKILSIAILASLLVFSFTVSSSTAISFAQREGSSSGGNQAAAQNSQDGNNDSDSGVSQSSSSSQRSECLSQGSTKGSCNNISVQANKNGNHEEPKKTTVTPESEPAASETTSTPVSSSVSCGEVIKQSVKLTSNLNCKTDGIIIGADGITVDLNGYSITGPGVATSKVALMLSDKDDVNVVGPGQIQNFQAGVLDTGGQNDKISGITFIQNQIGSFITGAAKTTLEDNMFFKNNIGVASHTSQGTELLTNLFKENDLAGATFVNSDKNKAAYNTIQGSVSGLFFDGQSNDNTVNANNILENKGVDINNANGLPLNVNNNLFSDNNCNNSVPVGLCLGK